MIKKIYPLLFFFIIMGFQAMSQPPVVTVRFANPQFDCETSTYCLDVEFLSDSADVQVFGMNVRFFYDDSILEFIAMGDFQGGYGVTSPNPPIITTGLPNTGPALFTMDGAAEYVNGAIQLVNQSASPVRLSTSEWTKLFNICFAVEDPSALNNPNFCPSVVWDLEADPANGGFLTGGNGVVISIVAPPPFDSNPTTENVVQYNWAYSASTGFPFGSPVQTDCLSTVCIEPNPAIDIIKTANVATYSNVGEVVTYTIIVSNTGNTDILDILVSDPMIGLNTIISSLSPGASRTFTEQYTITQSDIQAGSVVNVATAEGRDPNDTPVSDTDDAVIILEAPAFPALVITKYTNHNLVQAGDEVSFFLGVSNYGTGTAINVIVRDTLAEGFIFFSASNGGEFDPVSRIVTWNPGNLVADSLINLELRVIIADGMVTGTAILNQAMATADNVLKPAISCTAKVIVMGEADVSIAKTSDNTNVYPGKDITYTLIVNNSGPSAATNIRVTDYLPTEVTFISASHQGVYNTQSHSIDWTLPELENGSVQTLSIVVSLSNQVAEGASIINYATAMSEVNDPNPTNNTALHIISVIGLRADLAVTKQSGESSMPVGETVEYTIIVTNNGPDDAMNVIITDTLPSAIQFISANENGIHDELTNAITWNYAYMAPGETIVLTVEGRIKSDTRGGVTLVNMASAYSETVDPDLSNNTASAAIEVLIPDLFRPDVFSPNNDGINDQFVIRGLERYPNNSIIIINRWGNKVYEAVPYNNDWDGTNQFGITVGGNQLPEGTYYYILDLGEPGMNPIRGFIYLTR